MHVVQALVSLNLGGSELVATELSEYLSQAGHRVTVIASGGGPLQQRINTCGAAHLDWAIGQKRLSVLTHIRRLARWLKQERPDILHAHSRLPAWVCWLAIRQLEPAERPVFITSVHGHYSVNRYSAIMTRGDRVVAVSEHIREYILRNYPVADDPAKLVTIPGGTSPGAFPFGYRPDPRWFSNTFNEFPELQGKRLLCLPGRLARYKGHSVFIELIAALRDEYPDLHGVVIGKARPGSRFRNELEGLAERSGIPDRITFTGARVDIRDWLAAAEIVFSLCSDPPEAFGRTVPEALRLGIPVIGWNHGGVQEVLAEMFPRGAVPPDNPAELLKRTLDFLQNPPRVTPSTAYLLEDSMNRTLQLYQSAIRRENSTGSPGTEVSP
jgi:glycosyltransferase involved in cell wall biosynthesis